MDLKISGRKAIVCASSQGLGLACAQALAREGVKVVINGRNAAKLAGVREAMAAQFGPDSCRYVVADIPPRRAGWPCCMPVQTPTYW